MLSIEILTQQPEKRVTKHVTSVTFKKDSALALSIRLAELIRKLDRLSSEHEELSVSLANLDELLVSPETYRKQIENGCRDLEQNKAILGLITSKGHFERLIEKCWNAIQLHEKEMEEVCEKLGIPVPKKELEISAETLAILAIGT